MTIAFTSLCPLIDLWGKKSSSTFGSSAVSRKNSALPQPAIGPRSVRIARWTCVTAPRATSSLPAIVDADSLWVADPNATSRLSKIVCTLGPKTCDIDSIEGLGLQGMGIVRLNMSHGTHEWHSQVIENVRTVNARGRVNLGILLDTKGPEVRSGDLRAPIKLSRGERFVFTTRNPQTSDFGDDTLDVSYDDFVKDVHVGGTLLVDTSRRHLNVRGKSASLPAITDKDWEDTKFGMEMGVQFYALSFVEHEDDVAELKRYLVDNNVKALVLSKIESAEAVKRLYAILEASDGAMVARGDLGAKIPIEDIPMVQEEIVQINRHLRRPTIVATHMLESMITYPTATRAEVTDITEHSTMRCFCINIMRQKILPDDVSKIVPIEKCVDATCFAILF